MKCTEPFERKCLKIVSFFLLVSLITKHSPFLNRSQSHFSQTTPPSGHLKVIEDLQWPISGLLRLTLLHCSPSFDFTDCLGASFPLLLVLLAVRPRWEECCSGTQHVCSLLACHLQVYSLARELLWSSLCLSVKRRT